MNTENQDLRAQLRARLDGLRGELALGERRLQELDLEATNLRATLLRISGAVQVLEEVLGEQLGQPAEAGDPDGAAAC